MVICMRGRFVCVSLDDTSWIVGEHEMFHRVRINGVSVCVEGEGEVGGVCMW